LSEEQVGSSDRRWARQATMGDSIAFAPVVLEEQAMVVVLACVFEEVPIELVRVVWQGG